MKIKYLSFILPFTFNVCLMMTNDNFKDKCLYMVNYLFIYHFISFTGKTWWKVKDLIIMKLGWSFHDFSNVLLSPHFILVNISLCFTICRMFVSITRRRKLRWQWKNSHMKVEVAQGLRHTSNIHRECTFV